MLHENDGATIAMVALLAIVVGGTGKNRCAARVDAGEDAAVDDERDQQIMDWTSWQQTMCLTCKHPSVATAIQWQLAGDRRLLSGNNDKYSYDINSQLLRMAL